MIASDEELATGCLALRGITKSFPGVRAVDNVSLDFYPGKIHALMGENGAGKSTAHEDHHRNLSTGFRRNELSR